MPVPSAICVIVTDASPCSVTVAGSRVDALSQRDLALWRGRNVVKPGHGGRALRRAGQSPLIVPERMREEIGAGVLAMSWIAPPWWALFHGTRIMTTRVARVVDRSAA